MVDDNVELPSENRYQRRGDSDIVTKTSGDREDDGDEYDDGDEEKKKTNIEHGENEAGPSKKRDHDGDDDVPDNEDEEKDEEGGRAEDDIDEKLVIYFMFLFSFFIYFV